MHIILYTLIILGFERIRIMLLVWASSVVVVVGGGGGRGHDHDGWGASLIIGVRGGAFLFCTNIPKIMHLHGETHTYNSLKFSPIKLFLLFLWAMLWLGSTPLTNKEEMARRVCLRNSASVRRNEQRRHGVTARSTPLSERVLYHHRTNWLNSQEPATQLPYLASPSSS